MEFMKRMSAALSMELVNTASIFKHTGFRNEVEFRLLEIHSINKPPLSKKRGSPPKTINYTELDWRSVSPVSLESTVVGPAANFSEAESFVRDYLSNAGLQSVKVIKSGIPYRSTN
jgi:hypothetical protein